MEKIICTRYKADIPEDIATRYNDLIHERTKTEGKWGSLEKTLQETDKLLEEKESEEDKAILLATKDHINSMLV